jgi:hypothetical protein
MKLYVFGYSRWNATERSIGFTVLQNKTTYSGAGNSFLPSQTTCSLAVKSGQVLQVLQIVPQWR